MDSETEYEWEYVDAWVIGAHPLPDDVLEAEVELINVEKKVHLKNALLYETGNVVVRDSSGNVRLMTRYKFVDEGYKFIEAT